MTRSPYERPRKEDCGGLQSLRLKPANFLSSAAGRARSEAAAGDLAPSPKIARSGARAPDDLAIYPPVWVLLAQRPPAEAGSFDAASRQLGCAHQRGKLNVDQCSPEQATQAI